MFDETVVIDKNGINLLEDSNKTNIVDKKEREIMNNENFKFIEQKGDVRFYEDIDTGMQYQYVSIIGLTPIVDGEIKYETIKTFGDISIRYNLNGCYGYSIWSGNRCLEDNYWNIEQAEDVVTEMFFGIQEERSVVCKPSLYDKDTIRFDYKVNNLDYENSTSYNVKLSSNNKELIFKNFYFGLSNPSLEIVIEAVRDDYTLYKASPTLRDFKANRGEIEDIEDDYKSLKLDVKSMIEFF